MEEKTGKIMQEFEQQCSLYSDFTKKIENLIREVLIENDLKIHSISSRLKKSSSLKKKLERAEGKYSKLSDLTDISGIRVISYFADDVDSIAKVIEEEFDIDKNNSVDKRAMLDPDRFGYISLHYVAKLPNSRLQLTEYYRFSNCVVEIQVRSILQHTWAEIEHDLGYKSKDSVPKDIRRRFSRLAGLLELADSEFIQIRDSLQEYEKAVPANIIEAPESVLIDQASLNAFVKNSPIVHELDQNIASAINAKINETKTLEIFKNLNYNGLETIADIESKLREFGGIGVKFAEKQLRVGKYKELSAGISLFYLCYILAARNGSVEQVFDYLETLKIGDSDEPDDRVSFANEIISHMNAVNKIKY